MADQTLDERVAALEIVSAKLAEMFLNNPGYAVAVIEQVTDEVEN